VVFLQTILTGCCFGNQVHIELIAFAITLG